MKRFLKCFFDVLAISGAGIGTFCCMVGKHWGFFLMFGCFFLWCAVTDYKDETAKTKMDAIAGKMLFGSILLVSSILSILACIFLFKEGVI